MTGPFVRRVVVARASAGVDRAGAARLIIRNSGKPADAAEVTAVAPAGPPVRGWAHGPGADRGLRPAAGRGPLVPRRLAGRGGRGRPAHLACPAARGTRSPGLPM